MMAFTPCLTCRVAQKFLGLYRHGREFQKDNGAVKLTEQKKSQRHESVIHSTDKLLHQITF